MSTFLLSPLDGAAHGAEDAAEERLQQLGQLAHVVGPARGARVVLRAGAHDFRKALALVGARQDALDGRAVLLLEREGELAVGPDEATLRRGSR